MNLSLREYTYMMDNSSTKKSVTLYSDYWKLNGCAF